MIQKQIKKLYVHPTVDFRVVSRSKKDVNSFESFFEIFYLKTKENADNLLSSCIKAHKGFELVQGSETFKMDSYGQVKIEFNVIETDEAHQKRLILEKKKIEEQKKKDLQTLKDLIGKWDLKVDLPDEISNIEPKTRTRRKSAV